MNLQRIFSQRRGMSAAADKTILVLDPGHTTGYAIFKGLTLLEKDHITTYVSDKDTYYYEKLDNLIEQVNFVVIENYRVYGEKRDQHVASDVPTLQIIGAVKYMCYLQQKSRYLQMAGDVKGFWTNEKLLKWGIVEPGVNKHALDAVRHGCHFLVFNADYLEAIK